MQLRDSLPEFQRRGLRLLAISIDDAATSSKLVERLSLPFALGCDPDRSLTRAFGVLDTGNDISWPATFLVDAKGVVRWRSLAETYTVRPLAQVVLDAFDALPRAE